MEVNELKSHFHVKWENYKTTLGDAVNSGCHKDEIDDVISDNLEKQTTRLYECCNSGQVRKSSDDHMFDYDGKYVNHVGLQYNSTRKICGKPYIAWAERNARMHAHARASSLRKTGVQPKLTTLRDWTIRWIYI